MQTTEHSPLTIFCPVCAGCLLLLTVLRFLQMSKGVDSCDDELVKSFIPSLFDSDSDTEDGYYLPSAGPPSCANKLPKISTLSNSHVSSSASPCVYAIVTFKRKGGTLCRSCHLAVPQPLQQSLCILIATTS